jgi:hypothetical protein
MADQCRILQIERFHQLGEIVGVGVRVIALLGLLIPPA